MSDDEAGDGRTTDVRPGDSGTTDGGMTDDTERADRAERAERTDGPPTHFTALFGGVASVVRRRPALLVPFAVAGVVTAVVDALRVAGLVPTVGQTAAQHGFGRIVFQPVPTPVSAVGTRVSAWLGLELRSLLWAGGLELFGACCGALAAVWVLRHVVATSVDPPTETQTEPSVDSMTLVGRAGRLLVYQIVVTVLFTGFGIVFGGEFGPLGIPLLVGILYLAARLFLVPAGIAVDGAVVESIRWSWRQSRGRARTLATVVVGLGLGGNLLVSAPGLLASHSGIAVPTPVGSFVATALVSTTHAVVVGVAASRIAGAAIRG
jgi:hypothetical protein